MQHCKIFQISRKKIKKKDYVKESKYGDEFIGRIADFVAIRPQEREEDIELLSRELDGIARFKGDSFIIEDKERYFREKYEYFMKTIETMREITFQDFISDEPGIVGSELWRLEKSYEDKYGYYIDDNYGEFGLIPLDEFMREAETGNRFFIGAVVDYHT